MSRFSGKRAIVTGGGRGIGEAVARRLYDEGASVMVVSRTEPEVGAVAGALGERALAHVADVSLEADVQGIVDRALEVWGRIDVVVNNAGIDDDCPFLDVQADSWQRVLGVNRAILVSQRAACSMVAKAAAARSSTSRLDAPR
jgi:NAD(P)-dependent dehydrogenase (short-subunit alcohol dehydrogenase family)